MAYSIPLNSKADRLVGRLKLQEDRTEYKMPEKACFLKVMNLRFSRVRTATERLILERKW